MSTFQTIIFVVLCLLAPLALLSEVINPHSFVNSDGAFLRAAGLLLAIPLWVWFSKKGNRRLLIPGIVLIGIMGGAYLLYAISCHQQEAYYEKYIKNNGQ